MDSENEREEKIDAGQNTAHVALGAASRYAGGSVGGEVYDAVSKTKAGQAIERQVGKKIADSPLGDANKKLNDTGAVDALNTGMNMASGNKNGLNGNKTGGKNQTANNLRNKLNTSPKNNQGKDSLANKGADALKKSANPYAKAAGYAMGAMQKRKEKKEKEKEDNNDSSEQNSDSSKSSEEQRKTVLKTLKILGPIIGILLGLFMSILMLITILSPLIGAYSWFANIFHHKTDKAADYQIYDSKKNQKNAEAEKKYNDAIVGSADGSVKGIVKEYEEKYGVTIDWYLLNAVITYRYALEDGDKVYTSDGIDDIDEAELEKKLEELDESDSSDDESQTDDSSDSNNEESKVDYGEAFKKIETVASLMITKTESGYSASNSVGGDFYNTLIDSSFLKKYYKKFLKDDQYETRKKLVDEIFEYAENARILLTEDKLSGGSVISDTTIIHLQTCAHLTSSYYRYKDMNGFKIYDNPPNNKGTSYPDYMNMVDYIKGVVTAEIGISENYIEAMKAQAIAAFSFMLNDSKSGFDMKTGEMFFPDGTCRQAACYPEYGCSSSQVQGGIWTFYPGHGTGSKNNHGPLTEKENQILDKMIEEIFGKVMVNKGVTTSTFTGSKDVIHANFYDVCASSYSGKCFSQKYAINEAKSGMTYEEILKKHYSSVQFDIIDIKEGVYYKQNGNNYNTPSEITINNDYHYKQSDPRWASLTLCDSGRISGNGCNITTAATAISLVKNQSITPATLQGIQGRIKQCTQGSRPQMIKNFAEYYNLSAKFINQKDTAGINDMLSKIASGKYVAIIRIKANSGIYYSKNGHYLTIVSVKTENGVTKLLIWDPGSSSSKRDNAWTDLNYLLKYAQPSPAFILIGPGS